MCSHWNVISHLTLCWPSNFSRAGPVSALLCILSTKPHDRLLVVFVVEWVSFFFPDLFVLFSFWFSWVLLLHKFFCTALGGLLAVALLYGGSGAAAVVAAGLSSTTSVAVVLGLAAPRIFPDWGSSPCLPCWRVILCTLSHQEAPSVLLQLEFNSDHFL